MQIVAEALGLALPGSALLPATSPDLLEYAYKMDDGDQWNYIGRAPSISFSQLSPGRHVLTVKSTNADGVWYMPLVTADNNRFVTVPIRLNTMSNVQKMAADAEKK